MLLEVILAIALLAIAMTLVGSQITTAWGDSYGSGELTTAVFLAESKLAELDSGMLTFEQEMEGDFEEAFPGFGWRIVAEPSADIEGLLEVEISILRGERFEGDEDYFYDDESPVIFRLHTLRQREVTTGTTLDLQTDFGLDDEQLDEIEAKNPLPQDLTDLNLRDLANMDPEELLQLIPLIEELFPGMGNVGDFAGQDFKDIVDDVTGGESPSAEGADAEGVGSEGAGSDGRRPTDGGPEEIPSLEEFEEMMKNRNRR